MMGQSDMPSTQEQVSAIEACMLNIAETLERPITLAALHSAQSGQNGDLSVRDILSVARRAGLQAGYGAQNLKAFDDTLVPAMLLLDGGKAVTYHGRAPGGALLIFDPEIGTGDQLTGHMNTDDTIIVSGAVLDTENLHENIQAGVLGIDTDDDGVADHNVILEGDFTSGEFMTSMSPNGTIISFAQHITTLTDQQQVQQDQINGVINAPYLHGDTASSFTLTPFGMMARADFKNSLGVYEYDAQGNIDDVRLIAADASAMSGPITINGVDAGKGLGFFIIQNGYNRLDSSVLNSSDLSLVVGKHGIKLADDGNVLRKVKVFISHDPSLNPDGMEHTISGSDPNGGDGILLAFEDQMRNTPNADEDFQDVVFHIEANMLDVA